MNLTLQFMLFCIVFLLGKIVENGRKDKDK